MGLSALFLSTLALKRLIAGGLLLLIVAVGVFLWRQNQNAVSSSQIAPADCLVYFELPNLIQTAQRWPDTALCQIFAEPTVKRFLRQPVSKIPESYQSAWASIWTLRCSALFLGITDPNRESWVCGFQTSADQEVWRREISNISSSFFGQPVQEIALDHDARAEPSRGWEKWNADLLRPRGFVDLAEPEYRFANRGRSQCEDGLRRIAVSEIVSGMPIKRQSWL